MKQISKKLSLLQFTENNNHPFGNDKGRETFKNLMSYVSLTKETKIFEISLDGILATDASFPRESVVSVAKKLRGIKWFCLSDFDSEDLFDNWDYAASAKEQPLMVWDGACYKVIGSNLKPSGLELLDCVISSDSATTSYIAKKLNISVQNASTRLKNMANEGLIMRLEDIADSGGKEFIYRAVKNSD